MRTDWTRREIAALYHQPLLDLLLQAQQVHREFHPANQVQMCRLLSIKTGGCPEDCAYCPQSAHHTAGVERQPLMESSEILPAARRARVEGATRFCMGAAWRQAPQGREFDSVLESVRAVAALGMEVCCTLGMLTPEQARQLKAAGLTAYNHNLDSSPEFYGAIISTRTYQERLDTIAAVRQAGITVCCGGILGMGETEDDRIGLLHQLATLDPHPESVPINMLVRAPGTPLELQTDLDPLDMVRTIAVARILMPHSTVRLAAGRKQMSREAVLLCFMAGANSIFGGEKLLTTANPAPDDDVALLRDLGLEPMGQGATAVGR
ncbi:MAG TPA: biotin synthase BioB [Candidatus Saccharimonadales bacterium]|jgi:biotin synthase|nr:biotin synthase BioB [Candidatus Saccharimonadales bacterium]